MRKVNFENCTPRCRVEVGAGGVGGEVGVGLDIDFLRVSMIVGTNFEWKYYELGIKLAKRIERYGCWIGFQMLPTDQCDQMAKLFCQNLDIFINNKLPININKFLQRRFKMLPNAVPTKIHKILIK